MTPAARAEALFVSSVQPSEHPDGSALVSAIDASLRTHGGELGCACECAAEYGEHPETAVERMRWALEISTAVEV